MHLFFPDKFRVWSLTLLSAGLNRYNYFLTEVVRNVAKINNSSMPNFVISLGLSLVEGKVEEMVGLNIFATDFKMYLNLL